MNLLQLFAVTTKISADKTGIPTGSANQVLEAGLNIAYFAAGAVAVIIIIFAGYTFVTSGSDPAKVTKAKNAIMYSVVGLVFVVLAFVITRFIIGKL